MAFDGSGQFIESRGLAEKAVHTGTATFFLVALLHASGEGHYGATQAPLIGLQAADLNGSGESIENGHLAIHEDEIVGAGGPSLDGDAAIFGDIDGMSHAGEHFRDDFPIDGVVIHDEDAELPDGGAGRGRRRPILRLRQGEAQLGGGSAARGRCQFQGAGHLLHDAFADGEAETKTAESTGVTVVGLLEGLEHLGNDGGIHADTGVGNINGEADQAWGGLLVRDNDSHFPGGSELDGVVGEVEQQLMEAGGIDLQHRERLGDFPVKRESLPGGLVGEEGDDALDQVRQIGGSGIQFKPEGIDPRVLQNIVDDTAQGTGADLDGVGQRALFPGKVVLRQEIQDADDSLQGGTQLVANHGKEDRFGAARGNRKAVGSIEEQGTGEEGEESQAGDRGDLPGEAGPAFAFQEELGHLDMVVGGVGPFFELPAEGSVGSHLVNGRSDGFGRSSGFRFEHDAERDGGAVDVVQVEGNPIAFRGAIEEQLMEDAGVAKGSIHAASTSSGHRVGGTRDADEDGARKGGLQEGDGAGVIIYGNPGRGGVVRAGEEGEGVANPRKGSGVLVRVEIVSERPEFACAAIEELKIEAAELHPLQADVGARGGFRDDFHRQAGGRAIWLRNEVGWAFPEANSVDGRLRIVPKGF